jgi:hypothetical protein
MNIKPSGPPINPAACRLVRLSETRELTISPERINGREAGYRLGIRRHEKGSVHYVGTMLLSIPELTELARELQMLIGAGSGE